MSSNPLRFGVSTHLFHDARLDREHLVEIAAHDFEAVEVFATRTHFDYRDPAAVASLAEWLDDTRLELASLHAPISASLIGDRWGEPYSTATGDATRRRRALDEAAAALAVAKTIPYRCLVVHLGVPATLAAPDDNAAAAARESVRELYTLAEGVGVQIALEVIPNPLSDAETLVALLEDESELSRLGICLDVGHAHIMGDVGEATETCSGYLLTTHLHDNGGKADDHLVPYAGTIDWEAALLALQKVGYEGPWMFEVAGHGDPLQVLARTAAARRRFEAFLDIGAEMMGDSEP
ncbi:MAG: sugar phosphate isomerase/epimerase family protein [Vicinamibacterales bacterium]